MKTELQQQLDDMMREIIKSEPTTQNGMWAALLVILKRLDQIEAKIGASHNQ